MLKEAVCLRVNNEAQVSSVPHSTAILLVFLCTSLSLSHLLAFICRQLPSFWRAEEVHRHHCFHFLLWTCQPFIIFPARDDQERFQEFPNSLLHSFNWKELINEQEYRWHLGSSWIVSQSFQADCIAARLDTWVWGSFRP